MKRNAVELGWGLAAAVASWAGFLASSTPLPPPEAGNADVAAWTSQDVGQVALAGSVAAQDGIVNIAGAGADIWGAADGFHFACLAWNGDVQVIARVRTLEKTDPWAKAGIMIRADLAEHAPHAMVALTPEQGATLLRRLQPGGPTRADAHQAMRMVSRQGTVTFQQRGSGGVDRATDAITSAPLPRWIKLVRPGGTVVGYDSVDGLNWEWLGSVQVKLGDQALVGLAVTSHDHSRLCTATFDAVNISVPPVVGQPAPRKGMGDGLAGTYYPQMDFSGEPVRRIDPQVAFDWSRSAPMPGVGQDHFAVCWEGELEAQLTEPYALHVISDDRARLWLDGELLIDEWYEHAEALSTAVVNLEAGRCHIVRLDYFEHRGNALVKLLWSSPSTPQPIIPQTQLYSTPPPALAAAPPPAAATSASREEASSLAAPNKPTADNPPTARASCANLTPTVTGVRTVDEVLGAAAIAQVGRWEIEETAMVAVDRRGALEYNLNAPAGDLFQLEVEAISAHPFDADRGFYVLLSVDGEFLGRVLLDAGLEVLARAGEQGPVLASIPIRGLDILGVSESGAFYGREYDDGSRLVESAVAVSHVFPDVRVQIDIIVGGVMFDDGTLVKILRAGDFDETGLANVYFVMPPGIQTSNCHVMRAYRNDSFLGKY